MTWSRKYTYPYLTEFINEDKIITPKDAYLTRNTVIDFNCMKCNEVTSKGFRNIVEQGGPYCKPCTKLFTKDKTKETIQKLYQVDHISQVKFVKEKVKETNIKNFGVPYSLQAKEVREKIKQTNIQKYGGSAPAKSIKVINKMKTTMLLRFGVEFASQSDEIKIKIKNTNIERYGVPYIFQNKECREKFENTMLEKYGYKHAFQVPEFKQKFNQTILEKYNVENVLHLDIFKDKIKLTNLEKYGCEFATQSQQIKDKTKATNLEKYGTENPMQNSNIAEYCSSKCYSTKIYTFPSSNDVIVQGYEHFALDILLKTYQEEDFILKRADMPEIWYFESEQPSKIKRYFPDIYIPKDNLILEIKSTWTFEKNKSEVFDKKKATQYLGYNYEIWIISPKGEIIQKYDKKQIVYKLPVLQQ
jgi:hypothetical protein